MKKWKNVASYDAAKKWLKQNFPPEFIPVWSESGKSEMDTAESLLVATWLLSNSKNAAVRAAVHHNFIGVAAVVECDTDDGCPYYDSTGDYLGRGQIRYVTYRPKCDSTDDYGFAVIARIDPFDDDWQESDGYAEIAKEMTKNSPLYERLNSNV